jgi:hypothetical protein
MDGPTGAQDDGGAALHRGSLLAHGRPVLFNRALRPPTPSSCLADVCVVPPHPTVLPPSSLSSLNHHVIRSRWVAGAPATPPGARVLKRTDTHQRLARA